jgi:hypothetical protein
MKLMTKEILSKIPALYSQENNPDPIVHVKFFTPWSNWTWYATEYNPETRMCFGLVVGMDREMGYFYMGELEGIKGPFGLFIERDIHFKPCKLSEIKD